MRGSEVGGSSTVVEGSLTQINSAGTLRGGALVVECTWSRGGEVVAEFL